MTIPEMWECTGAKCWGKTALENCNRRCLLQGA
eukprot:CAMPEP_0115142218 /NCGR_PEP_ID=MMETSP0227-20121206/60026_1 /TAXON_ID=89957 /ORGANISM="Polarella glacialis, Strain CCMP 1383" /LENGTH=32 /DNA_ID= /DNA_START= /DNA_END= /DNA_ORIENTATION=